MKTIIFASRDIKKAGELIKQGELVAFPTETVYGLGADALNPQAVKKIFLAKGRPADNPLIVHIADKADLETVAFVDSWQKELVDKLTDKFWPGPLTIILRKKPMVPYETSAGLDTVAVRMPKNKIAIDLIKYSGCPIAAPSANISSRPSGTCFEHVLEDFDGKIAGIIRSKQSEIGLESTVVDLTTKKPHLLRSGGVSYEDLKTSLPDLDIRNDLKGDVAKSPGMKYRHYTPEAKIILFEPSADKKIQSMAKKIRSEGKKVRVIISRRDLKFAKNLFKVFRQCDKEKVDCILISSTDEVGIGLALMNRLRKAASEIVR